MRFSLLPAAAAFMAAAALTALPYPSADGLLSAGAAFAEEAAPGTETETGVEQRDWQAEFDDVCALTQDAMSLTEEELALLVKRCDALKERLDELEGAQKKVYARRLEMCRGVYAFSLESKQHKE